MTDANKNTKTTELSTKQPLFIDGVMPSLRCVWNGTTDDTYKITIGKTYPLIYNHENYYAILNDDGDVDTYNKSCFELVSNEV